MREKLLDLMKNEGLKPSQLAEMLGINPAGVSHILAGRNKPGFDLLQKILRRFPQINPDWLLLDSPKMYRDQTEISTDRPTGRSSASSVPLFGELFDTPSTAQIPAKENREVKNLSDKPTSGTNASGTRPAWNKAAVEQVVIFYDDKTFESFTPKRE